MNPWTFWPSIALIVASSVSGLGCSGKNETASDAIRIQLNAEPVSLDPSLAEDGISLKILANTQDGLVGYDGAGKLVNRLAQSVTLSADRKRYEFTLRPDARWSDGKPVRAKDFVFGLRRSLDPKTGSKLSQMLSAVREVSTSGDKLVIRLDRPVSYFLQVLTLPFAAPQRADLLKDGKWPQEPPSTGSYRIASHERDRKIVLAPHPGALARNPSLRPVHFVIVADESTASSLFEAGKLDILTRVPSFDFKRMEERGLLKTDPFLATYYLSFNTRRAPFHDRAWRRAVAGAIRKDEITRALGTGEMPARGWIPPGLEGHLPYVSSAREAHVKKEPIAVEIGFDAGARNSTILEKVQQDLSQGLGMQVSLSGLDWKSYVGKIRKDPSPIFRFGWLAPFQDPISHLQVFVSGGPNNLSGWSNAEYDKLVSEIEALSPGPARASKIKRAQEILVDREAAVVPLYHYVQTHAVSARVRGFRVNPFGTIRLDELSLAAQ